MVAEAMAHREDQVAGTRHLGAGLRGIMGLLARITVVEAIIME